jgi:hypothetical protein
MSKSFILETSAALSSSSQYDGEAYVKRVLSNVERAAEIVGLAPLLEMTEEERRFFSDL